ncbi:hypothetical protein [Alienimonas sp. DA493]|uniref:hypothetical protein n=1 Tax=Alienimonas sp. DA493 TaxID=3373605 RepID=UPI003754C234
MTPLISFADDTPTAPGDRDPVVSNITLHRPLNAPDSLSFTVHVAQHEVPYDATTWVELHDGDVAEGADGRILFAGWVETPDIGQTSRTVQITAHDPTFRAETAARVNEVTLTARDVFNADGVVGDPYVRACRLFGATVGEMCEAILDDRTTALQAIRACPAGGLPVPDGAFAALDHVPLDTVKVESRGPRGAFEEILPTFEPGYAVGWSPGSRQWVLRDVLGGPTDTLTLNDPDAVGGVVLALNLTRTTAGRFPAVKYTGPETLTYRIASTDTVAAAEQFPNADDPDVVALTKVTVSGYPDSDFYGISDGAGGYVEIARTLPGWKARPGLHALTRNGDGEWVEGTFVWIPGVATLEPHVLFRFDPSTAGDGGFYSAAPNNGLAYNDGVSDETIAESITLHESGTADPRAGLVEIPGGLKRYVPGSGSPGTFETPVEVQLRHAIYADPHSVRYPASGYDGTSYSVAGLTTELVRYDDACAVDAEYNVTTATRLSRMTELAQKHHAVVKDLAHAGGATLAGALPDWQPGTRVGIAAADGSGGTTTTGWESANAVVTEVTLDLEADTTTLTLDGDVLALSAFDVDAMKAELKIRAAQRRVTLNTSMTVGEGRYVGDYNKGGGGFFTDVTFTSVSETTYVDEYGETQ